MKKHKKKGKNENDDMKEIFKQDVEPPKQKPKKKLNYQMDPNVRGSPVDYSFRKVYVLSELEGGVPRQFRVGIPRKAPSGKYISSSLWANSNHLTDLTAVRSLVDVSFNRPELVAWLDVSFNDIQHISPEIGDLTNLKILYLHGNKIKFFIELGKLKPLTRLRTLTLHGNPIEEVHNYRPMVLRYLPWIVNLDFSLVMRDSPAFLLASLPKRNRASSRGAQQPTE